MSQPFHFRKFSVFQENAPFKVGTDGVLIGAWATHSNPKTVLDIGTGTGLIALMLAQRFPNAHITAVEINPIAWAIAKQNITSSPWKERMDTVNLNLLDYTPTGQFDLIACNPPFFQNSKTSGNKSKDIARHTLALNSDGILAFATKHLTHNGNLCIVVPINNEQGWLLSAQKYGLHLIRKCVVFPTPTKPPKRVLLAFGKSNEKPETSELVVELSRHHYSDEFKQLVKDFYLNL